MTELDSFASFRKEVASPSPAVRHAARDDLRRFSTSPVERRWSPRRVGALAAAGALAAGALVVGVLVAGGPSVVEQAEAAIDPQGRILHGVVRIESAQGTTRGESWVWPDGTGRSLSFGGGPADCLASETELRCFDAARNVVDVYRYNPEAVAAGRRHANLPGFRVDQPASIHRAFGEGYAQLVGETQIAGRGVYEILLAVPFIDANGNATPHFDDATSPVLYLDRETFHPVAQRFPDAESTTFYETYEFLADEPATRRLLELPTNAETRVVVHPVGEGPQS